MNGTEVIRIAIPYYGLLEKPGRGFERIYFLAELARNDAGEKNTRLVVWNTKRFADLSDWLTEEKIDQVVCLECPPSLRRDLEIAGIRVGCHLEGELDEKLASCLAEIAA